MIPAYTEEEFSKAKSEDLLKLKCEVCGKEFLVQKKLIVYELKHKIGRCKYCSKECRYGAKKTSVLVTCANCGKEVLVLKSVYDKSVTKNFFCCHSCSAAFNNKKRKLSEETKEKIKNSINAHYILLGKKREHKPKSKSSSQRKEMVCKVCGKTYILGTDGTTRNTCSPECKEYLKKHRKEFLSEELIEKMRAGGKKSAAAQGDKRRSKNEQYFYHLCKEHFNKVKHNEPMFNGWDADIIIEDIKVAVLWNGKWHYEQITEKHSPKQVQNRDNIKISEIRKCGYKPYIIKDMGKYDPKFVEEEFNKFIAG